MALIYIDDSDPWFMQYDSCKRLSTEIMEKLTTYKRPETLQEYTRIFSDIRTCLKTYNSNIQQLKNNVDDTLKFKAITAEEAERRRREIEKLESTNVRLQQLYDARINKITFSRANLLTSGPAFADGGTTSWAADDDDDDDDDDDKPIDVQMSVADLMTQQNIIVQEQNKNLEELCKVIARQKEIGQTIYNEVDHQNEIIDNLSNHMDRTDESLINKTRQIQTISFKSPVCGYWIVIILLFICIITVVFLP
ncbi:Syntaxin-8 [Eufriesea mexicana]|uniref:Syntaxin-8 n=1 Tax=Eufriesea mexicana TaxID=516756 RepID=A0A310S4P5_9HYME|nr:PREDICTED: syntaxin-8 [Eufriesea mexicana]OAD52205.1 Syntaxin-8 [Eufriesea mexicana]